MNKLMFCYLGSVVTQVKHCKPVAAAIMNGYTKTSKVGHVNRSIKGMQQHICISILVNY